MNTRSSCSKVPMSQRWKSGVKENVGFWFLEKWRKKLVKSHFFVFFLKFAKHTLLAHSSSNWKIFLQVFYWFHRLNSSSSPVLTATSLSYGKAKNSTLHRIKTPDLIEIKFGRLITSARGPVMQNFMQIPPKGASQKMGEIFAKIFLATYLFFRNSPTDQTLRRIFARDGSNDAVSRKDVPFGG